MDQPLLSVIVPCYHVEKYMDKCISSIVNQTYSNLEILLVDDGSTDETGKICDAWQEKDRRIRVIHKPNEGASYARKTGVEHATADYVTFVDADDWIDPNMYAEMMTALLTTQSDIAQCDFCIVHQDGSMEHRVQERDTTIRVMGRIESVIMILEDHGRQTSMGTKMFKKTLFEHVEFPKGRVYAEDMIVHDLFHHASQTVFLDKEYYFYLVRSGSISRKGDMQKEMKKLSDCSDAYYECYSFVNRHPEYHSALPHVKRTARNMTMGLIRNMIVFPQYIVKDDFYLKIKQLRSIVSPKEDKSGRLFKMEWRVLSISPKCYKLMRMTYVRIVHITNKIKLTNKKTIYVVDDLWWGIN